MIKILKKKQTNKKHRKCHVLGAFLKGFLTSCKVKKNNKIQKKNLWLLRKITDRQRDGHKQKTLQNITQSYKNYKT